ncbi:MAG: DNA-processing protein DprA [Fimbriimonas ginsengisoli]|uniref:DNA-processing protein DprA n=1 Tax=Fimbriimonas ginsengisoli TaxID=1005039 RepID=A0A931LW47_FIMGI|nr:DNA-processing protein DprA [Fimbriimonas ginsengisoli]
MSEQSHTTQLAILLTARWSANGSTPLSNSEFFELRRWMGTAEESAEALLLGNRDLQGCPIERERLDALLHRGLGVFQSIDRWLQAGLWVRSSADAGYPARFAQLKHRAPVLLFGCGDPNAFGDRALAIVGSRNASDERLSKAAEVGRACSQSSITVVSGGAKGVDSAAMAAAVAGRGTVVGILADSLLREAGQKMYREAILDGRMCLMSEVHPEARFDVGTAMARNRLAYACAEATLVVECDPNKGGTWAGAIGALREGKSVYVLQGARAEGLLEAKGAVCLSIEDALQPERLIAGARPPADAQMEPSLFDIEPEVDASQLAPQVISRAVSTRPGGKSRGGGVRPPG